MFWEGWLSVECMHAVHKWNISLDVIFICENGYADYRIQSRALFWVPPTFYQKVSEYWYVTGISDVFVCPDFYYILMNTKRYNIFKEPRCPKNKALQYNDQGSSIVKTSIGRWKNLHYCLFVHSFFLWLKLVSKLQDLMALWEWFRLPKW